MTTIVLLGNVSPKGDPDKSVTEFVVPEGTKSIEAVRTITSAFDQYHSDDPADWVESDNEALASLIAENYDCAVGRPADWDAQYDYDLSTEVQAVEDDAPEKIHED